MICSECKGSLGLLRSVETQTVESDWDGKVGRDNFDSDGQKGSEQECGAEGGLCKSKVEDLEGKDFIERNQQKNPKGSIGIPKCVAYRDVSDEAFEMDPDMELGTFAEMCHENDKVIALTRSFEYPSSQAKGRWKMAGNAGKAANRLGRLKKGKSPGINDGDGILPESEVYTGLGGCRRIVISSGNLPVSCVDEGAVRSGRSLNGAKEESHASLDTNSQLQSIQTGEEIDEVARNGSIVEEQSVINSDRHTSKSIPRRVSSVLGPNKRCLHFDEEQEQIDPEQYIDLPDTDHMTYNVVVVTRSFECGTPSDAKKGAEARWDRVRNARKFSKALSRFRSSNHGVEGDHDQMLAEGDEENFGPFVGSGYRRMSMKTIEEVESFNRKRKRFWKLNR